MHSSVVKIKPLQLQGQEIGKGQEFQTLENNQGLVSSLFSISMSRNAILFLSCDNVVFCYFVNHRGSQTGSAYENKIHYASQKIYTNIG